MLPPCARVASRCFGHKRQRAVGLYVPVTLGERRAGSPRVAVSIVPGAHQMLPVSEADSANAGCPRAGRGSAGPCLMQEHGWVHQCRTLTVREAARVRSGPSAPAASQGQRRVHPWAAWWFETRWLALMLVQTFSLKARHAGDGPA